MDSFYISNDKKFGWPTFEYSFNYTDWEKTIAKMREQPDALSEQEWSVVDAFDAVVSTLPYRMHQYNQSNYKYIGGYFVSGWSHTLNHSPHGGIPVSNGVESWRKEAIENLLNIPRLDKVLSKLNFKWKKGVFTRSLRFIETVEANPSLLQVYDPNKVHESRAKASGFALYFPNDNMYYTGKHRNTPLISGAILFENVEAALHSARLRYLCNFAVVEAEIVALKVVDTSLITQGSLDELENAISEEQRRRLKETLSNLQEQPPATVSRKM